MLHFLFLFFSFIFINFFFHYFFCALFFLCEHIFFSWNDMVFSRLIRFPWSFFFLRNKSINFFLCFYTVVIMYFISSRVFWKFTLSKKPAINKVNIRSIQGLRNSWCTYALFSFTLGFSPLASSSYRVSRCKVGKVNWLVRCRFDVLLVLKVICIAEKPHFLPL